MKEKFYNLWGPTIDGPGPFADEGSKGLSQKRGHGQSSRIVWLNWPGGAAEDSAVLGWPKNKGRKVKGRA